MDLRVPGDSSDNRLQPPPTHISSTQHTQKPLPILMRRRSLDSLRDQHLQTVTPVSPTIEKRISIPVIKVPPPDEELEKKCEENQHFKTPSPPPRKSSPLEYIQNLFETVVQIPSYCVSLYHDYFTDGNHPWKQMKYHLGLQGLRIGLEDHQYNACKLLAKGTPIPNEIPPFEKKVLKVMEHLYLKIGRHFDWRSHYRQFIDQLRDVICAKEFDEAFRKKQESKEIVSCIDPILTVCHYRFTHINLHNFCEQLVASMIYSGRNQTPQSKRISLPKEELLQVLELPLEEQFAAIEAAPQSLKAPKAHLLVDQFKGGTNVQLDPHRGSNLPYWLYDLRHPSGHTTRIFRTGTPTTQRTDYPSSTVQGEASINPEFRTFVRSCDLQGKKILYISLQDDTNRYLANEKERNATLLELHKEFPNTFQLFILAQDSVEYTQQGYPEAEPSKIFKDRLYTTLLFGQNKGYYLPPIIRENHAYQNKIQQLIEEVYEDLYGNKEILFPEERQDLLEVLYARIALHFMDVFKADYFCFCCKDSADRAMKCNAILLKLSQIFLGIDNRVTDRRFFATQTHASAIIVKKREMNFRRGRLLSVIKRFERDEVKIRLRKRGQSYENLQILIPPKLPEQDILS